MVVSVSTRDTADVGTSGVIRVITNDTAMHGTRVVYLCGMNARMVHVDVAYIKIGRTINVCLSTTDDTPGRSTSTPRAQQTRLPHTRQIAMSTNHTQRMCVSTKFTGDDAHFEPITEGYVYRAGDIIPTRDGGEPMSCNAAEVREIAKIMQRERIPVLLNHKTGPVIGQVIEASVDDQNVLRARTKYFSPSVIGEKMGSHVRRMLRAGKLKGYSFGVDQMDGPDGPAIKRIVELSACEEPHFEKARFNLRKMRCSAGGATADDTPNQSSTDRYAPTGLLHLLNDTYVPFDAAHGPYTLDVSAMAAALGGISTRRHGRAMAGTVNDRKQSNGHGVVTNDRTHVQRDNPGTHGQQNEDAQGGETLNDAETAPGQTSMNNQATDLTAHVMATMGEGANAVPESTRAVMNAVNTRVNGRPEQVDSMASGQDRQQSGIGADAGEDAENDEDINALTKEELARQLGDMRSERKRRERESHKEANELKEFRKEREAVENRRRTGMRVRFQKHEEPLRAFIARQYPEVPEEDRNKIFDAAGTTVEQLGGDFVQNLNEEVAQYQRKAQRSGSRAARAEASELVSRAERKANERFAVSRTEKEEEEKIEREDAELRRERKRRRMAARSGRISTAAGIPDMQTRPQRLVSGKASVGAFDEDYSDVSEYSEDQDERVVGRKRKRGRAGKGPEKKRRGRASTVGTTSTKHGIVDTSALATASRIFGLFPNSLLGVVPEFGDDIIRSLGNGMGVVTESDKTLVQGTRTRLPREIPL